MGDAVCVLIYGCVRGCFQGFFPFVCAWGWSAEGASGSEGAVWLRGGRLALAP